MDVYNKLYDNDNYVTLARLLADVMGENVDSPSQDYLNMMIDIQDRAITYSRLELSRPNIPLIVMQDEQVWKAYLNFIFPFAQYYQDNS